MRPLRILIADDHDLMRRGIRALLESRPDWTICAEVYDGQEAISQSEQLKPDVVILDLIMPELSGLEAAKAIRKVSPETEILVLSVHYSDQVIQEAIHVGVRGYIVKSDSDRDLLKAVERLSNHKPFFTARATELIFRQFHHRKHAGGPDAIVSSSGLSNREREIVQLVAEGMSSKQIASMLSVSVKTAETHRTNIMRKIRVHSVSELVRYAVRNRIVEP